MKSEDSPGLLLRSLVETTRTFEDRVLAGLDHDGLRPAHFAVFRYLAPDGSRIGELAAGAGMTAQAMGELVTKVRDLGFVAVRKDPADRRARIVELTEAGRAAMAAYADRVRAVEQMLCDDLGTRDVEELRRLLGAGLEALRGRQSRPLP